MSDFRTHQLGFVAAIRSPDLAIPSDVAPERMAVYRELFFNNIQNFVNSAFPVLRSILPAEQWQHLQRQFFTEARLSSPYFLNIAEGFLDWLSNQPQPLPFALELAHYEWAELYVATLPCPLLQPADLTGPLQLSECALVLSYQFPVHQISQDFQPRLPQAEGCYLLVYRNIDDQVRFIALNQLTAALLTLLNERPGLDFSALTTQFSELLPQLSGVNWLTQARELCFDLAQKGVIQPSQISEK
jgi:hypothetical protein